MNVQQKREKDVSMYLCIILPERWLVENCPAEFREVMELFREAGWQEFNGYLMPSVDMLEAIATKKGFLLPS